MENDLAANDFEYNAEYPANGSTILHFTDIYGNKIIRDIIVPDVYAKEPDVPLALYPGPLTSECYGSLQQ